MIAQVLAQISYKPGWIFVYSPERCYVQIQLPPDPQGKVWRGRKWLLSTHMTEGEIVQTALLACLSAEEHEAREVFQYKGKALFGPHMDMSSLLSIADRTVERPTPNPGNSLPNGEPGEVD